MYALFSALDRRLPSSNGPRSLIRRAALRALRVQPARQITVCSPVCSSRVTRLPSTNLSTIRSFHQIRASWAESDNETLQEQVKTDTSVPETREAIEITEANDPSVVVETPSSFAQAPVAGSISGKNTIYAGNLFFETTNPDLHQLFSDYGTVESVRIILDSRGRSKGYGFVKLGSEEEVKAAIEALHDQVFQGRRILVSQAVGAEPNTVRKQRDGPSDPSDTLFIGNLPRQMTDSDLNTLFAQAKGVTDVRVAIDRRTGQPRGFAHADFMDVESATKAKEMLEDKELYGRRLRLDYGRSSQDYERYRNERGDRPQRDERSRRDDGRPGQYGRRY